MILELYDNLIEKEAIDKSSFVGCTKEEIHEIIERIRLENSVCEDYEINDFTYESIPRKIVDFLLKYFPDGDVDLGADVIQLSKEDFLRENTTLMPGAIMVGFKYLTFASTTGGNAICFNLNELHDGEPSICIIDHSIVSGRNVGISHGLEMEFFTLDKTNVYKVVKKVASTFSEFLEMLLESKISDIESFLY